MSLVPAQISDLVALGAPILCLDTCTILDVVRDISCRFPFKLSLSIFHAVTSPLTKPQIFQGLNQKRLLT